MEIILFLFIVALIALPILLICVSIHNSVERARMRVQESLSNVDVFLCQRYDLTVQMVNMIKGYMAHESKILLDVAALRRSGKTVKEMESSSKAIDELLGKVLATAEAYPNLRSADLFSQLLENLSLCERDLQSARRIYNSNASLFNAAREEIPTCYFAKKHPTCDLFECESYKRDLPVITF